MTLIDKEIPISLHIQIRNEILGNILNEVLKPGEKLPSEKELCAKFGASRTTVRLALTHLSQKDLIYSIPGKGSFVAPSVMDDSKMKLIGFFDSVKNESAIEKVEVLETIMDKTIEKICSRLQIQIGEKIISIVSFRKKNNSIIGIDQSYLPYRFISEILNINIEGKSIDNVLASLGKTPKKIEQMIQACLPNKIAKRYLNLSEDMPMVCIERISFLIGDIPIEYRNSIYKGDDYRLNLIMEEK